ncbi:TonB-dependent receptor domain-containing protein [Pseudolysobacter antarcticus]|uniref:TonB-dependent receptor domain-containing protein n=1 Tax=Pseudolysobacter antarcticus TaxID=2511995 RepID=UPI0013EB1DAE|nr:TonB-dependent receptor [Pseudolysobacter antarcticus]
MRSGLADDRLPYVPKLSASLTSDYFFPVGTWQGNIGGGVRWVGSRLNGTTERQQVADGVPVFTYPLQLDSYAAIDLHASISNENWTIRGYVKNLADKRAYSSIARNDNQVTGATQNLLAVPIQPRTIGLEFDYRY